MTYPFDLPNAWFLIVGILLTGYAILDGFDLGVGALYLFTKGDKERRLVLNSIGPVWDGNEVWLLVGGGALFAAFPEAYATVFSGFYTAFMLLLVMLIFRAVAMEFRSKETSLTWRRNWDIAFGVSSIVIPVLMGVALGNMVVGIRLNGGHEYMGGFFDLLNPYALIMGVTTLALFVTHGSVFLVLKTEGELQAKVKRWVTPSLGVLLLMFLVLTGATFKLAPQMAERFTDTPQLYVLPVVVFLAMVIIPIAIRGGREGLAFVASCVSIVVLMCLFGLGQYPYLVPSPRPNEGFSLTVVNSASSTAALTTMMTIALLGMPFVLAYTIAIYWVFRGKVQEEHLHY